MGLDPYHLEDEAATAIVDAALKLPSELASEFFAGTEPLSITEDAQFVVGAIREAAPVNVSAALATLRRELSGAAFEPVPWRAGYAAAHAARAFLGASQTSPDGESMMEALGFRSSVESAIQPRGRWLRLSFRLRETIRWIYFCPNCQPIGHDSRDAASPTNTLRRRRILGES